MIHPNTRLRFIDEEIGYGVFATRPIPRGTMVYVEDALEVVLRPEDPKLEDAAYRSHIEKYSYMRPDGVRVLSWDLAKYVNHSCDSNSLTCGFGFEIAVRDIARGEELTDDYGMFNIEAALACRCGAGRCRGIITADDPVVCQQRWEVDCLKAMADFARVSQPLLPYLDPVTRRQLDRFLATGKGYPSAFCFGPAETVAFGMPKDRGPIARRAAG